MIARGPRVRWVAAGIGPAAAVAVRILLQIRQPAPVPPAPGALRPIGAKDRLLILAPHEADKALAKAGVRVESFPDGKNYWTFEPRGYRRHTVISSTRDPFWKQFTGEDGWPEFCVFKNHGDYCLYEPIPLDQLEWAESAKAERQAIMARGEEFDRKARDFEAIARDTRFAWMRTNLHTLTRERTVAGICELALAETVGWHSMFVGQRLHGEGVVEALIDFGWNLPITEHDGDHWSLECKENLDSIRMVLKDRPLRILDVLAARWESNIGWNYWRQRHGVDDMGIWYDVLERIGYKVSEDERKALKGAYLGGGDDES